MSAPLTILRSTDKAGLMHTADVHADLADASSICNCCTDCCYPHLASERLGVADVWPVRRYVAGIDTDALQVVRPLRPALPVRRHRVQLQTAGRSSTPRCAAAAASARRAAARTPSR